MITKLHRAWSTISLLSYHEKPQKKTCNHKDCQNFTQPEVPDQPDLPRTWKLQLHPIHGNNFMWSTFQNQSQLPSNLIVDKVTGRFTSTSTWCLCSTSWATNSLSSAWKSIFLFFLACDKTNRPADWFYSTEYFQVQVCRCGGDRRELPETTKSAPLQNPLLLQHPLTKVVTKIH